MRSMKNTFLFAAALAASAGAQAAPLPCQPQSLLDAAAIRERVILVGELHGTNEMPAFASGLACSLLQQGRQVVLSLELPSDVQPEIDRYLASDGGEQARQPLYDTNFGKLRDGRGSVAYMAMMEQVRVLRNAGAPITLAATDAGRSQLPGSRDRVMAENIVELARKNPLAAVVSLSGNLHAAKLKGGHAGADYEPLGYLLTRQMTTHAIVLVHAGGAAWVCMPQCGVHEMGGAGAATKRRGYDKVVNVGSITASPPVREKQSALRSEGGAQ